MQEAVVVFDDWLEYWNKKVSTYLLILRMCIEILPNALHQIVPEYIKMNDYTHSVL